MTGMFVDNVPGFLGYVGTGDATSFDAAASGNMGT